MSDYRQRSRVTELSLHLKWDLLESRRLVFQLKYVHYMLTNQVALEPNDNLFVAAFKTTRNSRSKKIMPKLGRADSVKLPFCF